MSTGVGVLQIEGQALYLTFVLLTRHIHDEPHTLMLTTNG